MSSQSVNVPRKRFGQHFLRDAEIARRVVTSVTCEKGSPLVEIGPGRGALTTLLEERNNVLHIIEIDRDLAQLLSARYLENERVTVYKDDALKFDYAALAQQAGSKMSIVGNLPYNISTALLFQLLSQIEAINEMVFMVQREIAERLTARPGAREYGRLTVIVGRTCAVSPLFEVGSDAFYPKPKVQSSVVRLVPRTKPLGPVVDREFFADLVRDAFAQRRKTLRNALKHYKAETVLKGLGIDSQLRAERLSIEQFAELAAALKAPLAL